MVVILAVGLGGAADEVPVGVVDAAVRLRAVARGRLGILAVAVDIAGDGVFHDDVGSVNVRAEDGDRGGPGRGVDACLDFYRPVAVIREAELRPAPADRGVEAGGQIAHGEVVAAACVNLEVCKQRGVVERAGDLADAAADLLHDLAAGVCARGLIAARGGALAEGLVVVKLLAGHEHDAVYGLAGELHVVYAVGAAAAQAGHDRLAEIDGEEQLLIVLGRILGLGYLAGYLDRVARAGGIPEAAGLGLVEVHAVDGGDNLVRLGVIARVLRLAEDRVVQAVDVQRLGLGLAGRVVKRAVAPLGQGLADEARELVDVYAHAVRALDHADDALVLVQLHAGALEVAEDVRDRAGDEGAHRLLVHLYPHLGAAAGDEAPQIAREAVEEMALVAVVIGRLRGLLRRDGGPGLRRRHRERVLHGQRDRDRLVLVRPAGDLELVGRLGEGHASDVDAADGYVGVNRVRAGDVGGEGRHAYGQRRKDAGADYDRLLPRAGALLRLCRARAGGGALLLLRRALGLGVVLPGPLGGVFLIGPAAGPVGLPAGPGAGLVGLGCAYRLKVRGVAADMAMAAVVSKEFHFIVLIHVHMPASSGRAYI